MNFPLQRTKIYTLIIVILVFVILESGVRLLLFIFDKSFEPVVPLSVVQFDPELGWSLIPSSSATSDRTGYNIEYRINTKGLRDDETNYEKPDSVYRIVLIGDSRTFGFGVPITKHFSRIIEGYFTNLEVINLGVHGYGIDQQLLYLQKEGFKYNPDLVLAYIAYYGEHRHLYAKRWGVGKPQFLIKDGELQLNNSPVMNNPWYLPLIRQTDIVFSSFSKTYSVLRNYIAANIIKKESVKENTITADLENEKKINHLGNKIIKTMLESSIKNNSQFVVVTHMENLEKALLQQNIITLNVTTPLSNRYFLLPDNLQHVNESGNGVLAWEIAEFLQSKRLIPEKHLKNN